MKVAEALIAWTPMDCDGSFAKTAGTVKIGHLLHEDDGDWTQPYLYTGGAAFASVRELSGAKAVARVFIDFQTMVVRDGIPVELAHEAFLVIDEYAENIAPDISGSKQESDF